MNGMWPAKWLKKWGRGFWFVRSLQTKGCFSERSPESLLRFGLVGSQPTGFWGRLLWDWLGISFDLFDVLLGGCTQQTNVTFQSPSIGKVSFIQNPMLRHFGTKWWSGGWRRRTDTSTSTTRDHRDHRQSKKQQQRERIHPGKGIKALILWFYAGESVPAFSIHSFHPFIIEWKIAKRLLVKKKSLILPPPYYHFHDYV